MSGDDVSGHSSFNDQLPMEALMRKVSIAVALGFAAALAACSENAAAPRSAAPDASLAGPGVAGGGATADLAGTDTTRFSITINPWEKTYYDLGAGNRITFPARSVCDPYRTNYGVGTWDQPCSPASYPITVKVKAWLDRTGHARVDFDKHLRFVPSSNPWQWVVITFADYQASLDPFFNILYCQSTTGGCIDESKTDPSLLTVRDPVTGKVTRRIKHFSGYNVAAGEGDGGDSGMMNAAASVGVPDDAPSFSVSTADLQLDDLASVARAHPTFTRGQVEIMLRNIHFVRQFSGYILASG